MYLKLCIYNGKKLMIVSYIEGKQKNDLSPDDCKQIGKEVAKMHTLTKDFSFKRKNNLSIKGFDRSFIIQDKDEIQVGKKKLKCVTNLKPTKKEINQVID